MARDAKSLNGRESKAKYETFPLLWQLKLRVNQLQPVTVEVLKLAWDKMIDIVSLDVMDKTRRICASADTEDFLYVLDTLVDRIKLENDDSTKTRLQVLPHYK